jgi:hypothetical protein
MDFSKALQVDVEKIERPPLPPIGHYVWEISKPAAMDTIANGRFDTVDFTAKAVEATADVDTDELKKYGGIKMLTQRVRFMFNKGEEEEDKVNFQRTLHQLKTFLTVHCGLPSEGNLAQVIDAAQGARFMANIQYRPDKANPENVYAELGRTAPVK